MKKRILGFLAALALAFGVMGGATAVTVVTAQPAEAATITKCGGWTYHAGYKQRICLREASSFSEWLGGFRWGWYKQNWHYTYTSNHYYIGQWVYVCQCDPFK